MDRRHQRLLESEAFGLEHGRDLAERHLDAAMSRLDDVSSGRRHENGEEDEDGDAYKARQGTWAHEGSLLGKWPPRIGGQGSLE